MVIGRQIWERNYNLLAEFKRQHGHCNVQTNAKDNLRLGRWVAQQRHRKRENRLQQWQLDLLEKLAFAWSACDNAWHKLFRDLIAFKHKHGHCNVPCCSISPAGLAAWVASQRHRRKIGTLQPQRIRKLESIGFCWAVYGMTKRQAVRAAPRQRKKRPSLGASGGKQVLCYCVAGGRFVSYDGNGAKPKELQQYITGHNGQMPPHIPLPTDRTVFVVGDSLVKNRGKVVWKGKGRLPKEVLQFVNENGALPPPTRMLSNG